MYLSRTKACIVDALQQTFSSSFIPQGFQVPVSIEYPLDRQSYPSIWVNYDDNDSLAIAGIGYIENAWDFADPEDSTKPDPNYSGTVPNQLHQVTRWMFSGEVTLTFVALTSLERDNLYDQFVRVFAFSRMEGATTDFRTIIETNPFIAINVNWDELRPHGDAAAPGTPWGTDDEVIYEKSLGFDIMGEFISDPGSNEPLLLSSIVVTGTDPEAPMDQLEDNPFILGIPRSS